MAEDKIDVGRSRRELLKKMGVGGALVWASPVVGAIAAPPAYAASSGCTVSSFNVGVSSAFVGSEPVRRLEFSFDLSGCPAAASFRMVLSSQPLVPDWNTPLLAGFLSPSTTSLPLDSSCVDYPFDTTVTYDLTFFDSTGDNALCTFSGTVVAPACV